MTALVRCSRNSCAAPRAHERSANPLFSNDKAVGLCGACPPGRALRGPGGFTAVRTTELRRLICPSGCLLSSLFFGFSENISVPIYPETLLELSPSHPTRGAYHDRHGRGVECGGRGSVLRATGLQGGLRSVSDQQRADERCCCVRRSRVVLTPRRWRQVCGVASAQPGLDKT